MVATQALSLNCTVCQKQLVAPITLSCGYTICIQCLPQNATSGQAAFVCPVSKCKRESHLFGPSLCLDTIVQKVIQQEYNRNDETNANILQCSMDNHLLSNPVTCHCGHTFCKLCLLQHKLSNDQCKVCQKRLPSYQFIQNQPVNFILESLLYSKSESTVQSTTQLPNITTSISFLNHDEIHYKNVPVILSDFPILPSQKLRLPVYNHLSKIFLNSLISSPEYQCFCIAILSRSNSNKLRRTGTIVRITAIENRAGNTLVDVTGLDRFHVSQIVEENQDFIIADLEMKFEALKDLNPTKDKSKHWVDYQDNTPPASPYDSYDIDEEMSPHSILIAPPSPDHFNDSDMYGHSAEVVQLANYVHNFISKLAHSTPSISFCSAIEGLLGPVWLGSVQGLHGPLPSPENPIAICWWIGIVLPISSSDRCELLETSSLVDRLELIVSWIHDLETQRDNSKQTLINSAAKILQ